MSTRYFLGPNQELLTREEPDRCQTYWKLAGQAHQAELGMPGYREIQQRLRAHLKHCQACSDWFAMHLALGEAEEEPVFGELPAAQQPAAPVKPYQPRPRRKDWWRSHHPQDASRLDRLDAMFGRNA